MRNPFTSKNLNHYVFGTYGYKWCGPGYSAGRYYKNEADLPSIEEYRFEVKNSIPLNLLDSCCTVHDIAYTIASRLTPETIPEVISQINAGRSKFPRRKFYEYFRNNIFDLKHKNVDNVAYALVLASDMELMDYMAKIPDMSKSLIPTRREKMYSYLLRFGFWGKGILGVTSISDKHGKFVVDEDGDCMELNKLVETYEYCYENVDDRFKCR